MSRDPFPADRPAPGGAPPNPAPADDLPPTTAACPACGGRLVEVRAKLVCSRCRTICETCCEGGPG